MTAPRAALTALYLPVLLILLSLLYKTAWLLGHGERAGIYFFPYAGALWLVGRRALRAWRGELERPWVDACLLAVAAGLWGFLVLSQFR